MGVNFTLIADAVGRLRAPYRYWPGAMVTGGLPHQRADGTYITREGDLDLLTDALAESQAAIRAALGAWYWTACEDKACNCDSCATRRLPAVCAAIEAVEGSTP
jgi:hypothetical protein